MFCFGACGVLGEKWCVVVWGACGVLWCLGTWCVCFSGGGVCFVLVRGMCSGSGLCLRAPTS